MHDRKHNLNEAEARQRDADHLPPPHDRRHGLDDAAAAQDADDHAGERDLRLSARSLAARGEAPDGSEDGLRNDAEPEA
jgi:hypothetical protein